MLNLSQKLSGARASFREANDASRLNETTREVLPGSKSRPASHVMPNRMAGHFRSRKAVVTVTNNSILRALCRSQLRAVRREKPCPSGSRLPRRGRFCASMHPGVTCCPPRARNGSVFWRRRLWSTRLTLLASRQTCRSRRAAAPVSHALASQRAARPVQQCYSRNVITPFRSVVSVVVVVA